MEEGPPTGTRPASGGPRDGPQISAPRLTPPRGGGAVQGLNPDLDTQDFTGTASFTIPLTLPEARARTPSLALSYSSAGGNGAFGMGFSLGLDCITRKTSTGIPTYTDKDVFILSSQGQLTPALTRNPATGDWRCETRLEPAADPQWQVRRFRPRVEAAFDTIEHWQSMADGTAHWRITTRENIVQIYGRTPSARIFDPDHPARIFQWQLEEVRDPLGNRILYRYRADDSPASAHGHDVRANRYIEKIEYGNAFGETGAYFAFRASFDYEPRPDAFSSYRSGFEIRTALRCRAIRVHHYFPDDLGDAPVLTRSFALNYEPQAGAAAPSPDLSLLRSVQETGHRIRPDDTQWDEPAPPLLFDYARFAPEKQGFAPLRVGPDQTLPGPLSPGAFLPIDLDGEGLPGMLYSDGTATLYYPPLGGGAYGAPVTPACFPDDRDLRNPALSLVSLEGDGRKNLVSRTPQQSGFFTSSGAGRWARFQPFTSVPTELADLSAEMVDMTGDGRADLVVTQNPWIKSFEALGKQGYGPAITVQKRPGFPASPDGSPTELILYADIFGDGLSHKVRLRNGALSCWPNLGYGHFGAETILANAPVFDQGLDARRIFFADVDGTGCEDLIYVTATHMRVYLNQSGNGFSNPLILPLAAPFDDQCEISFADINGTGADSFILTRLAPSVRHDAFDFTGGVKPYLLTAIDNQQGAQTRLTYESSVKQYLADKAAGRPWPTPVFFPVHVVTEVEQRDEVSKARYVETRRYHDGYYDPEEREFQGFGHVESWDSQIYEEFVQGFSGRDCGTTSLARQTYSPPQYTRSWFQTGAFFGGRAQSASARAAFWTGDPDAPEPAGEIIPPAIFAARGDTVQQAYLALSGQPLRTEVYGLDGSAQEGTPYSVTDFGLRLRMEQPAQGAQYAAFLVIPELTTDCTYDRHADDPRIEQNFVLAVDEYGNTTRGAQVAYPRRPGAGGGTRCPEQELLHLAVQDDAYVNHPQTAAEPFRWIGVTCDTQGFEIAGVRPKGRYFSAHKLAAEVDRAMQDIVPYGAPLTPGAQQARRQSWQRTYFWNADQTAAMKLRRISARGLIHHTEQAVLTGDMVGDIFGDRLTPEDLRQEAGLAKRDGYWWNRGLIAYYFTSPEMFYLPCKTDGLFDGVDPDSHLNPTTTVAYDAAAMLIRSVTQYVTGQPGPGGAPPPGAVVLQNHSHNDYQAMQPWRITDENDNVEAFLFSPLGMVIVGTQYGTEDGRPAGDKPLSDYTLPPDPSFGAVVHDPAAFLQSASSYFYYNLFAWLAAVPQPVSTVEVTRLHFAHQLAPGDPPECPVSIAYFDGLGREIERKDRAPPGEAVQVENGEPVRDASGAPCIAQVDDRWVASERTVFNNKGEPVEQYLPYFTTSPDYEDQAQIVASGLLPPPTTYQYDAIGRLIRTNTPKGFFTRTAYGVWQTAHYDENDTVRQSPFYKSFPSDPKTQKEKNERNALDKALACENTPTLEIYDTRGLVSRSVRNNLGAVGPEAFRNIAEGAGISPQALWDDLVAGGYLTPTDHDPALAWVAAKTQPYLRAFQTAFAQAFGDLAAPILNLLMENGLTTRHVMDFAGREVRTIDPRLFYANITEDTDHANFRYRLDMQGQPLLSTSADAGKAWVLYGIFGNILTTWDLAGIKVSTRFDRLQRPTQVDFWAGVFGAAGGGDASDPPDTVERMVYGETRPDAAGNNLMGQLYDHYDEAGRLRTPRYSLDDLPQRLVRQVRADAEKEANWTAKAMQAVAEGERFVTEYRYDPSGMILSQTTPDGSATQNDYDIQNRLIRATVQPPPDNGGSPSAPETIVGAIAYDALGQRRVIGYGNGVTSRYRYEDTTNRLIAIRSERAGDKAAPDLLQDLAYTYDPVGNVTRCEDHSWQTVFAGNQEVGPLSDYRYDPIYQLRRATGRQQPGLMRGATGNAPRPRPAQHLPIRPTSPGDTQQLEAYTQHYAYDTGGNLVQMRHVSSTSWTRDFPVADDSNRLLGYGYDANGNMLDLESLPSIGWSYRNALAHADILLRDEGQSDSEFYLYDSNGNRVLKRLRRLKSAATADQATLYEIEDRIYVGAFETRRIRSEQGGDMQDLLIRDTLSVMDDDDRICLIQRWPLDRRTREAGTGSVRFRYQLSNLQGSVTQELDRTGKRISYEEYMPYGGTAFIAADNAVEVAGKDYRYCGKELDSATGLYNYGARYYPPWLGRWINPDPSGVDGGINLYAFVMGNPVTFVDSDGRGVGKKKWQKKKTNSYTAWRRRKKLKPWAYSMKSDVTVVRFIGGKYKVIGERGMLYQIGKKRPTSSMIRVAAIADKVRFTMGQGLHEILPTSMRYEIANINSAPMRQAAAETQSGARTTPALQPLVNPAGGTAGHTGTYVHPSKPRSSQYTKGQAAAHDTLRDAARASVARGVPDLFLIDMLVAHLDATPTGPAMLADGGVKTLTPNLLDAANTNELAFIVHERREEVKDRTKALIADLPPTTRAKLKRSPSFSRLPLDKGGGYATSERATPTLPSFSGSHQTAQKAAFATQPMRV